MRILGITRPGVADLLTVANAICGTAAVLLVASGRFNADPGSSLGPASPAIGPDSHAWRVVTFVLLAGTILDVLDGAVARRFGGTALGSHLDNLADAVTFGIAPAMALGVLASVGASPGQRVLVIVAALGYVAGALLRLADFAARHPHDEGFTGIPTTLAAVAVIALGYLSESPVFAAVGLGCLGLLMVSRVRYPRQAGVLIGFSLAGWALGLAGIAGVVDVRIPSALALGFEVLVLPVAITVLARRRGSTRSQAAAP